MDKCVHIFVSGRVHGVFFRASTRDRALRLRIKGFVRNLPDHRVEIVANGSSESIGHFIQWCRSGPPGAEVDDVQVIACEDADEMYSGFDIAY